MLNLGKIVGILIGLQLSIPLILSQELQPVRKARPALGTTVSIKCYGRDTVQALSAIEEAYHLLDSLNLIFSDYNPESEIRQIAKNYRKGVPISVSQPLYDLTAKATELGRLTEGSFNIAVSALTQLWRSYLAEKRIPPGNLIRKFKRQLKERNLQLQPPDKLIFKKDRMRLDFGGIAKGYIGDQMAKKLREKGIGIFLIDLGGDLVAGDAPPDSDGWKITISWCEKIVTIVNQSIATSGPDFQFHVYQGKRYSHIIDPKSGWGVSDFFGCTVIAGSGYEADALASAFSILPFARSTEILSRKADIAAIIGRNSELISSDNFSEYVVSDGR